MDESGHQKRRGKLCIYIIMMMTVMSRLITGPGMRLLAYRDAHCASRQSAAIASHPSIIESSASI
jgi:hypothetical protein